MSIWNRVGRYFSSPRLLYGRQSLSLRNLSHQPKDSSGADVKGSDPIPADSDVIGPGASSKSRLATPFEQTVGAERLEMLGELSGRPAFLMEPLRVDHYGTLKDPIRVDSVEGRRLVGCTGFPKYSHDPWWFWVEEGEEPIRCIDCGQAFRINKLGDSHHHHHHHK